MRQRGPGSVRLSPVNCRITQRRHEGIDLNQSSGTEIWSAPRAAIVSARHNQSDIRVVNKIGRSLHARGFETLLCVRAEAPAQYLGMRVVPVRAPFEGPLRFIANTFPMFRQMLALHADLYICINPDCLPLALLLKVMGKKVVYDTHEDFLYRVAICRILPKWLQRPYGLGIGALEWVASHIMDMMLVTQKRQRERLRGRPFFVDNAPLTSGPIVERAAACPPKPSPAGELRLIYAGVITSERNPLLMLDVLEQLSHSQKCRLDLVGWFTDPQLERKCRNHPAWALTNFHGQVPHWAALAAIRDADIGLALLSGVADIPFTGITKIFEYMMFGVPFVASDFPYWRQESGGEDVGIFVNCNEPAAIAKEIIELYRDAARRQAMSACGRARILGGLNWETRFGPLSQGLFELAIARRTPPIIATEIGKVTSSG